MQARRAWYAFIAASVAILLSACSSIDAEQELLCRRIIPALVDVRSGVEITDISGRTASVAISFHLPAIGRDHLLQCQFVAEGLTNQKRVFKAVALDRRPLGPSALQFLTSGWLETQDSVAETPPPKRSDVLIEASPTTTFAIQHVVASLPRLAIYALLAAAYALIYGLIGQIKLHFGAISALGGTLTALTVMLLTSAGGALVPVIVIAALCAAVLVSSLLGNVLAHNIERRLSLGTGQQALIASLGIMIALEELLRLTQGLNGLWLPSILSTPISIARSPGFDATVTPMALIVSFAGLFAAVALQIWMARSRFGRAWKAVADDPQAAEMFGVSSAAIVVKTSTLAAALAGFVGFLVVLLYGGVGSAGGSTLGLTALTAAILGGVGSISGAMLGGVVIATIEGVWSVFFSIENKDIVIFCLLAVILVVKPDGLFSGRLPGPMRV